MRGPEVDHEAGAGGFAHHRVEHAAPVRRHHTEAGQVHAAREAVRRDPVARAHQPEQRRRDRQPSGGPPAGDGVERAEVEGVVQHAGVDRVGACGGVEQQPPVASYLVGLGGAQPERLVRAVDEQLVLQRCGRVMAVGAQVDQRREHLPARLGEGGETQLVQGEPLAPRRGGLALRRGKQDQHRASLGPGLCDRCIWW